MVHYDAPDGSTMYPIDDPPEPRSMRDLAEEQRKLAALPLPYAEIPQLAEHSKEPPQRPAPHVLLDGLPALQFVEQVLPQLAPAGVRVRLEGERREYLSQLFRSLPSSVPTPPTGLTCTSRSPSTERRCLSRICSSR